MAQLKPPACLTSHCTDCAGRSVHSRNGLKSLSVLSRRSKVTSHLRWPRNTIDVDHSIFCACGTIKLSRGCCSTQALATLSHTLPRLMRAAERQRRRQEVDSRRPFTIRLTAGSCTTPDDAAVPAPYLTRLCVQTYAKTYARPFENRPLPTRSGPSIHRVERRNRVQLRTLDVLWVPFSRVQRDSLPIVLREHPLKSPAAFSDHVQMNIRRFRGGVYDAPMEAIREVKHRD